MLRLPWDERERLGTLRAWWQTCSKLILNPDKGFAGVDPEGSIGSSLGFVLLSSVVGFASTMLFYVLGVAGFIGFMASADDKAGGGVGTEGVAVIGVMGGVLYFVFAISLMLAGTLLMAGLEHLLLLLLGGRGASYSASIRAHALSMTPYVLGLVPFCGLYVSPIWALVIRIFALKHFHQTTGGKATAAVLLPMVVMMACCCVPSLVVAMAGVARIPLDGN